MTRTEFIISAGALREYSYWEKRMYAAGLDFTNTSTNILAERLENLMRDGNPEWSYDKKLGFDWIIEWAYTPDSPNFVQIRHGCTFNLNDAGALYDFLVFMNEHGWED